MASRVVLSESLVFSSRHANSSGAQARGEQHQPGPGDARPAVVSDQLTDLNMMRAMTILGLTQQVPFGVYEFDQEHDHVRAAEVWGLYSAFENNPDVYDEGIARLAQLAAEDPSPVIRLNIASITGRLPLEHRWNILEALVSHPEDAADQNLPLMYWYAMEPLTDVDPQRALALGMLAGESIPMLRDYMIRRLGSGDPQQSLALLISGLSDAEDDAIRVTFLKGILGILRGRQGFEAPEEWHALQEQFLNPGTTAQNFNVYLYTLGIASHFGDASATEKLKSIVIDEAGAFEERKLCFTFLMDAKADGLNAVITTLLQGTTLRADALRAAAVLDDPAIGTGIVDSYAILNEAERRDAVSTLASRLSYANLLLDAVRDNQIASRDLSGDVIRQLRTWEMKLSTNAFNRCGASFAILLKTRPGSSNSSVSSSKPTIFPIPTSCSVARYSRERVRNVTRSTLPAAESAPTLPARIVATSLICSPTSAILLRLWRRSISRT